MLKFSLINFKFFRFVNSGLYFDFFLKKLSEIFVRNFFVYTALFFGEKFFIEVLTKKVIDNYIYLANTKFSKLKLNYDFFFYQIVLILFYVVFFFNVFFFFI
jgi:hypothetical protein